MRGLRLFLLAGLAAAVLADPPAAAQSLGGLATGSGAPLEIFADRGIEWLRSERKYVARGNALARQGDTQVAADVLTAHYRESGAAASGSPDSGAADSGAADSGAGGQRGGNIYRIVAEGNVVITSPDQVAYAERAVYFVDEQIAVLRGGNLRLETAEEVVTARDSLEYWENYQGTPVAVARGDATVLADGRRLEAEELVATLRPDDSGQTEIVQIDAFGEVEISSPEEYARGDRGVYYVKEEVAILAGDVRITQGETQLNGQRAEVNMATGVSRLLPTSGGRVQGILTPREGADGGLPARPDDDAASDGAADQDGPSQEDPAQ